MAVPLDAIRAFHNAFRLDIRMIDNAAEAAAQKKSDIGQILERYVLFNDILVWHADGEEQFIFTALERVAPLVAEAYERDHRGLDTLFGTLKMAVDAFDILAISRATSAFRFFLNFHLNKEEAHLYRIFNERISLADQWAIMGSMAQRIPQERFPAVVDWLFRLIGPTDQENMTRIFQKNLPAPVFSGVTRLIRTAVGDGWTELASRVPELNSVTGQ